MFMREENLKGSIDGICVSCGAKDAVKLQEEFHVRKIYKVGSCTRCDYEHHILVRKL